MAVGTHTGPTPGMGIVPGPHRDDEQRQLAGVCADLVREFGEQLGTEQVQQRFAATVSRFDGAPIRSFVPVLARRCARQELRRALESA